MLPFYVIHKEIFRCWSCCCAHDCSADLQKMFIIKEEIIFFKTISNVLIRFSLEGKLFFHLEFNNSQMAVIPSSCGMLV